MDRKIMATAQTQAAWQVCRVAAVAVMGRSTMLATTAVGGVHQSTRLTSPGTAACSTPMIL